jgi:hypothetical protein
LRGKPGCAGSSPGNPLGDAPVPMIAGHQALLNPVLGCNIAPSPAGGAYDDDF